ncbi:MAG TPA: hypothetical protein VEV83_06760 [Parafilimonas sp.]|nr:hypothetical protein [Parafilimonas sp.]
MNDDPMGLHYKGPNTSYNVILAKAGIPFYAEEFTNTERVTN